MNIYLFAKPYHYFLQEKRKNSKSYRSKDLVLIHQTNPIILLEALKRTVEMIDFFLCQ